jgi:hypothetical protein
MEKVILAMGHAKLVPFLCIIHTGIQGIHISPSRITSSIHFCNETKLLILVKSLPVIDD